jgi:hypothetical protein
MDEAPTMNRDAASACSGAVAGLRLLVASSRLGLEREVLVKRQQHTLLVATFAQLENPIPRPVWAGVAPGHRHVVRHLLEQPAAG